MTDAERHAPRIPAPRVRRAMLALAMPLVGLLYIAQGIYYARVLVPSGDMTVYLVAGSLAVRGELNLFDDRLPGHRAPLPFYVLGLTQVHACWNPGTECSSDETVTQVRSAECSDLLVGFVMWRCNL